MANDKSIKSGDASPRASSPFATGGGGNAFESKVHAGLLTTLLVKGYVPLFEDALLQELHLQSEHLGYRTDDALVVAHTRSGRRRRQLWSVKHEVKFTESDSVFRDVIGDALSDFQDPERFDEQHDAFILATRLVAAKPKHLIALLEFARASSSAQMIFTSVSRGQGLFPMMHAAIW